MMARKHNNASFSARTLNYKKIKNKYAHIGELAKMYKYIQNLCGDTFQTIVATLFANVKQK